MSQLFTPYALGSLQVSNRIAIAPMCQYSAENGEATDWHMIHLGHLALSGAGVLFIEATAVQPEGRITAGDLGLWSDEAETALGKVIRAIRAYSGIPVIIQLSHAGRKASSRAPWEGGQAVPLFEGGWQTVAPSALPHAEGEPSPVAMTPDDVRAVKNAFVAAAKRAQAIGINGVELHAAHGYLLHQFLSPLANIRTDQYGGSLANRMRFPLEVFEAVREALPEEIPLGVRLSATDWVEGGWDLEQSTTFCQELKRRGCAFVHVSSGGVSPLQKIPLGAGYQIPFAARIKADTGLPTIGVGLITEARLAEEVVANGDADMVALARAMLYDPRWPWHAAAELGAQVEAPPQYWRSQPREHKDLFGDTTLGQR
jgi:2,4-dienoyl-CoA reductase-like NADH-dependent reductase (Old Yellow Enzyme family)